MEQNVDPKLSMNNIVKKLYSRRAMFKREVEINAQELEQATCALDPEYVRLNLRYKSMVIENAKSQSLSSYCGEYITQSNGMLNEAFIALENYKKSKGYDFTPNYKCNRCKDTLAVNDSPCVCIQTEIKAAVVEACGIRANEKRTFAEVDFSVIPDLQQRKELTCVYDVFKSYAEKFKAHYIGYKPKNVLLCGSAGLGKTFLLECIYTDAIKRGVTALYFKAFELAAYFLKISLSDNQDKAPLWDMLFSADLLFIDDLGTEPIYKNVSMPNLFQLVDHRTTYNKPLLISTNLDPDAIMSAYEERVSSRILDTEKTIIYGFYGKDLRIDGVRT